MTLLQGPTAEDLSTAKAAVARCRQLWVSQRQQVAAARKLEIEGEPAAAVAAAEKAASVALSRRLVAASVVMAATEERLAMAETVVAEAQADALTPALGKKMRQSPIKISTLH